MKKKTIYYCDHCGEEIIGFVVKNGTVAYEQTENGLVETSIKKEVHICSDCYQEQENINKTIDKLNEHFIDLYKKGVLYTNEQLENKIR